MKLMRRVSVLEVRNIVLYRIPNGQMWHPHRSIETLGAANTVFLLTDPHSVLLHEKLHWVIVIVVIIIIIVLIGSFHSHLYQPPSGDGSSPDAQLCLSCHKSLRVFLGLTLTCMSCFMK